MPLAASGPWRSHRDAAVVREAMAQLPDPQRAMIYHSHYLGRTTTQIADALGTDGEAVKHELHRALHALRMTLLLGQLDNPARG
jgi:DNA-directed RNA polymerase specialized sigma24 family protein